MENYNNDNIGYLLNKASRSLKWNINRKLENYNLTAAQWAVLKDLQMNEQFGEVNKATPAAIAERLNMDRPTMSGITSRMYKSEWIETVENPEDKRSQIIKLTDKSRGFLYSLENVSDEVINTALLGFNSNEVEVLRDLLNRIIKNLAL